MHAASHMSTADEWDPKAPLSPFAMHPMTCKRLCQGTVHCGVFVTIVRFGKCVFWKLVAFQCYLWLLLARFWQRLTFYLLLPTGATQMLRWRAASAVIKQRWAIFDCLALAFAPLTSSYSTAAPSLCVFSMHQPWQMLFCMERAKLNYSCRFSGILSQVNLGMPNTQVAQFFICLAPCPHFDGKYTVFGKVVEGLEIVRKVGGWGSATGQPSKKVEIADCGECEGCIAMPTDGAHSQQTTAPTAVPVAAPAIPPSRTSIARTPDCTFGSEYNPFLERMAEMFNDEDMIAHQFLMRKAQGYKVLFPLHTHCIHLHVKEPLTWVVMLSSHAIASVVTLVYTCMCISLRRTPKNAVTNSNKIQMALI